MMMQTAKLVYEPVKVFTDLSGYILLKQHGLKK